MENEQRTNGIAEWAAALRVPHTEQELAAVAAATREREAARSGPKERQDRPPEHRGAHAPRGGLGGASFALGETSEAEVGDDEVAMPVTEEEVVVEKWPVVKEEVRVRKDVVRTPRSSRRTSGARR